MISRHRAQKTDTPELRVLSADFGPGSNLVGQDLSRTELSGRDLTGSNLSGANLQMANLARTKLVGANLSGALLQTARLVEIDLHGANLQGAYLQRTNLEGAYLRGSNLTGSNMSSANLQRANLEGAALQRANLSQAILGSTVFAATDLSKSRHLQTCRHLGASIIDFETLSRSWPLPLQFLRGVGLPDEYIEYLPSLCGKPINFYSCFISYSERDLQFVERLHADLQSAGIRCWFAPEDMQGGRKIHEQIERAIHVHDRLLLILSRASMASEWVKTEIAHARSRELREQRRILFPISLVPFDEIRGWKCFDADTGKDSAREIREYYIPSFERWTDPTLYRKALSDLRKHLLA